MSAKPMLHGDNGATLKATTVWAMLNWLGVKPSYSRPRVSNDNRDRKKPHGPSLPHHQTNGQLRIGTQSHGMRQLPVGLQYGLKIRIRVGGHRMFGV